MKIDRERLLALSEEEAARVLYEEGKSLQGVNLKRSSWLVIASALRVQRISAILLQRLDAARSRPDALRVLRIARKWVKVRKGARSGKHGKLPLENPLAVALETSPARYAQDERELFWEDEIMMVGNVRADYEEWLEEISNSSHFSPTRIPGLPAVSTLQDSIQRYAWEHRPAPERLPENLRNRLDETTYERLLQTFPRQDGVELAEHERAYLERHNLMDLLRCAQDPPLQETIPIEDGWMLAGARMIEDRLQHPLQIFQVHWPAISDWLSARLALPPDEEHVTAVIASAYAFFRDAPAELVTQLLKGAAGWQAEWRGLQGYAYQRVDELLPAVVKSPAKRIAAAGWNMEPPNIRDVRWERVLDAGCGSRLVLHQLHTNLEDLLQQRVAIQNNYWNAARKLLLAGGGTLRRMDYPAFDLICRPSISLMRLETFAALTEAAQELVEVNTRLTWLNHDQLAEWIESTFEEMTGRNLPPRLGGQIAVVLERHAIAYLMLKERVLREALQAAPFRLRGRHIERFWADQASSATKLAAPAGLVALRRQFDPELVKEALAHALLDHFKDRWEDARNDALARPLKETLLTLLRHVAITYHMQETWLPDGDPEESDLEHSGEVANFLIQQTSNAPLELAQALLLDPHQGLPRLAGGQSTRLEQRCRRLIHAAAGVSQKKVEAGEVRSFTCRPLSKVQALDRGSLAGDCSSGSVPLRALSPHHVHYGIFEKDVQQRGYMTVYEAWAKLEGREELRPVLCLETINVPITVFSAVQQDLLVLFEAVARSRGLAEGLVLISGINTWNYQNGEVLRQSRRYRQGRPVRLFPADPASWNVYRLLSSEAESYTAFFDNENARRYADAFRVLAPYQADQDTAEPENLAEAQRIAGLPPCQILITARSESGPVGFISQLPEIV